MYRSLQCTLLAATTLLGLNAGLFAETIKVPTDQPTIQAAIDAAQPGDEVRIKGGLYLEEVVVDGKSDLLIKAKGVLLDGGFGGLPLTIRNSAEIEVIGLNIAKTTGDGALVHDVEGIRFQSCSWKEIGDNALTIARCEKVVIRKCKIIGTVGRGIEFDDGLGVGDGTNGITVEFCKLKDIGTDGIWLNGDTVLIQGCKLRNIGQDGIGQSIGSLISSATIINNKMKNPGPGDDGNEDGAGISVRGINILIANNKVRLVHDGPVCIRAAGMSITIQGNKTIGASTGIEVANIPNTVASEMFVLDNVVTKPDSTGIEVQPDVLGAVVQGNKVKNAQRSGIVIWGSLCQVIANTANKAKRYGFEAADGANTFSGNVATGSGNCDLYDHESENQTTNIYNGNLFPETCHGS